MAGPHDTLSHLTQTHNRANVYMSIAYASTLIDAPVDSVWQHLRNFGALGSYESNVQTLALAGSLSGDQVGSVRTIVVRGGHSVRERLLSLSDIDHTAAYTVEIQDAPFENAVSQFKLLPVSDRNATFIEWSFPGTITTI